MTSRATGIKTIALMTFLEARRNRIATAVMFFAIIAVATSVVFQEVTTTQLDRIVRDAGLAAIRAFGLFLAVFMGVSVVSREIDRKTVYMLVSKPLRRGDYILGKLAGIGLALAMTLGLMVVVFVGQQLLYGAPLRPVLLATCWLVFVELMVVASFSVFASTFVSPLISAFMSVGLFLIGELSSELVGIAQQAHSEAYRAVLRGVFYLVPNFDILNLSEDAAVLRDVSLAQVAQGTLYGGVFIAAFTLGAVAVFGSRDLK